MASENTAVPATVNRRRFLLGAVALGVCAAGGMPLRPILASAPAARPRIVVVGAGAAGLSVASRLSRELPAAEITVLDRREVHQYQPGYTLVAAGLWRPGRVQWPNADCMPSSVRWIRDMVGEFDPDANRIVTEGGTILDYDFLVVATGLELRYDRIEGMDAGLIGTGGIGSVYAGAEAAARTWQAMAAFREQGGVGLFTRPAGDMKCAGAPLKMTLLADDRLRETGSRGRTELHYNAHDGTVFGVPVVNGRVLELFGERGIHVNYHHVLEAIDPGARRARFRRGDGTVEIDYDFIHVVPPMAAPRAVAEGPLAWQDGPFAAQGWLEVDPRTLRHRRYPNVFGVGDVNGVPKGKTAASVKWQAPVAVRNLVDVIGGREPGAAYNGYTSCPLITGVGQAMLIEFDYDGNLIPTVPFVDPLKASWAAWVIEDQGLRPMYAAMLRGRA